MAFVDRAYSGLSNNIHGGFEVPDWLSAEHSTGVSKILFYCKDIDELVVFNKVEHLCEWCVKC